MSGSSLKIINGWLVDPKGGTEQAADLFIHDGQIIAIGAAPDGFVADQEVDAAGMWVMPGVVDLAVRLPEPGYESRGSIDSELAAAVAGGVTTLCCTPDSRPVIDSAAVVKLIAEKANQAASARVKCIGALTQGLEGIYPSEMHALKQAGCVALTNLRRPFASNRVLLHSLAYAATHQTKVFLSPVDHSLEDGGCCHEGAISVRLGLAGIPEIAETSAIATSLLLVEETGVQTHYSQLSSAHSVELIRHAQQQGLPVTAGVAIHQLLFTEASIEGYNSAFHLQPPLRTEDDRAALIEGVIDGTIGAICSDHQPVSASAKMAPFAATESGISGLQTLLPLAVQLLQEYSLSAPAIVERLTHGPSAIIGLEGVGLTVGSTADITIFDPNARQTVNPDHWFSGGLNNPYMGKILTGKVAATFVGGRKVYESEPDA
ncbi:MAG: dihydroorotase [Pseudomonadales bacterium]|nr:dihydroorotase [Pseudomonadales bacterium]